MFRDFFTDKIAAYKLLLEIGWDDRLVRATTKMRDPSYKLPPADHAFVITTLALALVPDCFSPLSWNHGLICPNDLRDRNPVAFAADHLVRVFSKGEAIHSVTTQHNRALHFIYLIAFNTTIWYVALMEQKIGSAVVALIQGDGRQSWDQLVSLCLAKAERLGIVAELEPDRTTGGEEAAGQVGVSLADALERAKANARQSYPRLLERYVLPEAKGRTETRQSVEGLAELCEPFAAAARGDFGSLPLEVRHRLQDQLTAQKTQKRGGDAQHVPLHDERISAPPGDDPERRLDRRLLLSTIQTQFGRPLHDLVASYLAQPDLTQVERAETLGITDRTLRTRLKLLRRKLPQQLQDLLR
jgi:hypothetical protein